jgi:hypothetical protein
VGGFLELKRLVVDDVTAGVVRADVATFVASLRITALALSLTLSGILIAVV